MLRPLRIGPVRILEGDPAAVGASYMADDDPALDRIFPNESCNFRMSAWLRVVERAAAFSFVQCDAPSVSMWTGGTAAPHQPGKAEGGPSDVPPDAVAGHRRRSGLPQL